MEILILICLALLLALNGIGLFMLQMMEKNISDLIELLELGTND